VNASIIRSSPGNFGAYNPNNPGVSLGVPSSHFAGDIFGVAAGGSHLTGSLAGTGIVPMTAVVPANPFSNTGANPFSNPFSNPGGGTHSFSSAPAGHTGGNPFGPGGGGPTGLVPSTAFGNSPFGLSVSTPNPIPPFSGPTGYGTGAPSTGYGTTPNYNPPPTGFGTGAPSTGFTTPSFNTAGPPPSNNNPSNPFQGGFGSTPSYGQPTNTSLFATPGNPSGGYGAPGNPSGGFGVTPSFNTVGNTGGGFGNTGFGNPTTGNPPSSNNPFF